MYALRRRPCNQSSRRCVQLLVDEVRRLTTLTGERPSRSAYFRRMLATDPCSRSVNAATRFTTCSSAVSSKTEVPDSSISTHSRPRRITGSRSRLAYPCAQLDTRASTRSRPSPVHPHGGAGLRVGDTDCGPSAGDLLHSRRQVNGHGPDAAVVLQKHRRIEADVVLQAGDDQALVQEVLVYPYGQQLHGRFFGVDALALKVLPELGHVVGAKGEDVEQSPTARCYRDAVRAPVPRCVSGSCPCRAGGHRARTAG